MDIEQEAAKLANDSPVTKAMRDNKSCIIVEKYEDGDVYASLRIEKTTYTFGPKQIEGGGSIENIVEHMIDPMGRKVEIHIMPFNGLEIHK